VLRARDRIMRSQTQCIHSLLIAIKTGPALDLDIALLLRGRTTGLRCRLVRIDRDNDGLQGIEHIGLSPIKCFRSSLDLSQCEDGILCKRNYFGRLHGDLLGMGSTRHPARLRRT